MVEQVCSYEVVDGNDDEKIVESVVLDVGNEKIILRVTILSIKDAETRGLKKEDERRRRRWLHLSSREPYILVHHLVNPIRSFLLLSLC